MSEGWKPEKDEDYFFINFDGHTVATVNNGYAADSRLIEFGNCFRTRKAAEVAAEKVKALLLSLHEPVTECNQLPKLTAEVFNLEACPKWAKYAAVDENGIAFYYRDIPRKACETWRVDSVLYYQEIRGKWDASDWKHSLIERPVNLPDWCKVGEWCYCLDDDGNPKYFKITTIKDNYIYGEDWDIDYHFVKQARPRPYNAKEMRGLIGKVVGDEHGNLFSVTAFVADDGGAVCVNGVVYNANDLLEVFTIGNEPCGVLEHLNEKGEWVE